MLNFNLSIILLVVLRLSCYFLCSNEWMFQCVFYCFGSSCPVFVANFQKWEFVLFSNFSSLNLLFIFQWTCYNWSTFGEKKEYKSINIFHSIILLLSQLVICIHHYISLTIGSLIVGRFCDMPGRQTLTVTKWLKKGVNTFTIRNNNSFTVLKSLSQVHSIPAIPCSVLSQGGTVQYSHLTLLLVV